MTTPRQSFPFATACRVGLCALVLTGLTLIPAGCSGNSGKRHSVVRIQPQTRELDSTLVIGPTIAREIGYRVDWQYPLAGKNLKHLSIQHDAVFALDERNYLTRIDREDGTRVWRIPVSYPLAEIQGITYLPAYQRVLVISGGDLFVLNAADGSQIARQKLEKIANTQAIAFGNQLIYGSRNGQLIWHSHEIAFQSNAYHVAQSIKVTPIIDGRILVVVGNDGEIMVLDAASVSKYWSKKLLDNIVASPVIGSGAVYVAGLDQHVWAFDLGTGHNLWRYLTESPLTESPVVIEDRVFQQVPSEGLVCFEALPDSKPGGQILWTVGENTGSVITRRQGNLITWDNARKKMVIITEIRGGHVATYNLPLISELLTTSAIEGELYASSVDGRIVRLVPRN